MIQVQKQQLRFEGELSRVYHLPMYEKVDLQQMIEDAYNAGEKEITIPRGAYRIWPKEGARGHLVFSNMQDFTVNAYGCVFLFQKVAINGIRGENGSENVTIRGFSCDYEDAIFTQMRITAINDDSFEFEVDEGYPMYDQSDVDKGVGVAGRFYDDFTDTLVFGTSARPFNTKNLELLGGRKIRLNTKPLPFEKKNLKVGDYFCPMCTGMSPYGISVSISGCGAFLFEDCTFWSSTLSCIAECYSEGGSTYRGVKIMPGPKPLGASHRRLHSFSGDAFHLTADRKGPTIEYTYFNGIQDDGINIHGIYSAVEKVLDKKKVIFTNATPYDYRPGDLIRVYNEDLDLIQNVHVKTSRVVTGEYQPEEMMVVKMAYATFHGRYFHEVELEEEFLGERGCWIINANCIGDGFIFRNNAFTNITPRGALVKSSNGVIENNIFDGCSNAGIKLITEFHWMEGDYSTNVLIRNNQILNCGHSGDFEGGGIIIDGDEAIEHHGIVIEDNYFENNFNKDLHFSCVDGMKVRNNTFGKTHPIMRPEGVDLHPTVFMSKSKNIEFTDNFYESERLFGVIGTECENIETDVPYTEGAWASDCIPGPQGRGGWHWQYAPIGTEDWKDYPTWVNGKVDYNGWYNGSDENEEDGCVLRLWWDTYLCPGTKSDVCRAYTCPKDGTLVVTESEPIKAGDIDKDTDGLLVCIQKNAERIWPTDKDWQEIPLFCQHPREIRTVEVKKGDVIRFRVNKNQIDIGNGTSWNPMVYYLN